MVARIKMFDIWATGGTTYVPLMTPPMYYWWRHLCATGGSTYVLLVAPPTWYVWLHMCATGGATYVILVAPPMVSRWRHLCDTDGNTYLLLVVPLCTAVRGATSEFCSWDTRPHHNIWIVLELCHTWHDHDHDPGGRSPNISWIILIVPFCTDCNERW